MRTLWTGLAFVLAAAASPAHAAWLEASTPHFVIDADASEARVRDFAQRLEGYHWVLRQIFGGQDDAGRRSNRVHIYAASLDTILAACGGCSRNVRGFYHPRAGGSLIFTTALGQDSRDRTDLDSQTVLLHEYMHEFMLSNFPAAYPMWVTEGMAEYASNVRFMPDGTLELGLPANYRAYSLFTSPRLSFAQVLDPPAWALRDPEAVAEIYARGWATVHYFESSPARRPMLTAYLLDINKGMTSAQAAPAAFGDVGATGRAVASYVHGRIPAYSVKLPAPEPVEIAALSPGAAEMMPVHMRSTAGVDPKAARALLPAAERIGAKYPSDPRVQVELAEAEFDAGNLDAADAAADRVLAARPGDGDALLYKGRVAVGRLVLAKDWTPERWTAARAWYVRANHADTEALQPLILYYRSFPAAHRRAPEAALDGLWKAYREAPEDPSLHLMLARRLLVDGQVADARAVLRPVAYQPHGGGESTAARTILDKIDAGQVADARAALSDDADGAPVTPAAPAPSGAPPPPPPAPAPAAKP